MFTSFIKTDLSTYWSSVGILFTICSINIVSCETGGQDLQNLNNDTFYRPLVTSAQCIIGTEKYPDSAILLDYNNDNHSQGYGQIKEAFKSLTKDDILQPYISDNDFRSSNNNKDIGYNLYVFDIDIRKILKMLNQ